MKKLLSGVLSVVMLFSLFFTNGLAIKNCEASFSSSSYYEDKEGNQYDVNRRVIVSLPTEYSFEAETEIKKEKSGFLGKVRNLIYTVFVAYVGGIATKMLGEKYPDFDNFLNKNICIIKKIFRISGDKVTEITDKIIGSEKFQKFVQPYIKKFKDFFADENKSKS